jgi:uncharacterized protein (TIGR02118 family)
MSYAFQMLYPRGDAATFNKEHYLGSHMPLVSKLWGPLGLKNWEVVEYTPGPDGAEPIYFCGCTMTWESEAHYTAALGNAVSQELIKDVPNYFTGKPVWLNGGKVCSK